MLLRDWLISRGVSSECTALCFRFFCFCRVSRLATTIWESALFFCCFFIRSIRCGTIECQTSNCQCRICTIRLQHHLLVLVLLLLIMCRYYHYADLSGVIYLCSTLLDISQKFIYSWVEQWLQTAGASDTGRHDLRGLRKAFSLSLSFNHLLTS